MPRRTTPDPLALKVGRRVAAIREKKGLTLNDVAEAASGAIDKGHVSSLERGLLVPNLATLKAVADGLGTTVVDLVRDV